MGSAAVFGVGLIALSRAHALWLALPLMLATGGGMMLQMAASNRDVEVPLGQAARASVPSPA